MGADPMDRMLALIATLAAGVSLTACAIHSYAGIPLTPGEARPDIQNLASAAMHGNKHAQLELGIRYQEGRGLPKDLDRAKELFRAAASDSGGTLWVYSPPVGKEGRGRTIPIDRGPFEKGLPEAGERLRDLERAE